KAGEDRRALIAVLTGLRRRFPQLHPRRWVEGRRADGSFGVLWLTPQATEMTPADWNFPQGRFLSYVLAPFRDEDAALFIVLNAAPQAIEFLLPDLPQYNRWTLLLQTAVKARLGDQFTASTKLNAPPHSVLVFSGLA